MKNSLGCLVQIVYLGMGLLQLAAILRNIRDTSHLFDKRDVIL